MFLCIHPCPLALAFPPISLSYAFFNLLGDSWYIPHVATLHSTRVHNSLRHLLLPFPTVQLLLKSKGIEKVGEAEAACPPASTNPGWCMSLARTATFCSR